VKPDPTDEARLGGDPEKGRAMPATDTVKTAVSDATPVVKKLAKDEKFRKSVADAAKTIYDQLDDDRDMKALAAKLATDPAVQKELAKHFSQVQKSAKKATKKSHKKRNALILGGIVIGLLYNPATGPETRQWIREKVVGADETFEYEGLAS
jgi:hypothetical protein